MTINFRPKLKKKEDPYIDWLFDEAEKVLSDEYEGIQKTNKLKLVFSFICGVIATIFAFFLLKGKSK